MVALVVFAGATCQSAPPTASVAEQPPRTVAEDAAVLEKGRISAQRKALARLGAQADPAADRVLIGQFERERTLAKSPDLLSHFQECLEGGDGEAGRVIFTKKPEAGCIRCHTVDGKGGRIGPDLTWLRHSVERMHILEAIVLPNSTIAAGFQSALFTLENVESISGVVSSEGTDEITITSIVDGKKRVVKTADITERTPLPSPMPPHFGAVLDKRAVRDLVEFLAAGD